MKALIPFILLSLGFANIGWAQTTAFTYQGKLTDASQPANGLHDLRFKLFDAASGGTQVGTTQCSDNILVSNGVFAATLDFGNQFATPDPRFIEIEVRRDTGLNCSNVAGFVVLASRQAITPTPVATHAKSAFALDAANGSITNVVSVDNSGRVGIGTTSPTHAVHIANPVPTLALQDTDSTSQQVGFITYRDSANIERAWVGYGTAGSSVFSIVNARPAGHISLLPLSGGNVGIGTSAPTAALDVRGDIRLGPSGQFRAVAAEENLRIVRGSVNYDGSVLRGSGFTAVRIDIGKYRLTFNPPFTDIPTVTATGYREAVQRVTPLVDVFAAFTPSEVTIVTWNVPANDFINSKFEFTAIGMR